MFGFLKRVSTGVSNSRGATEPDVTSLRVELDACDEPIPTTETTEGNDEATWKLWEDAVSAQDGKVHADSGD